MLLPARGSRPALRPLWALMLLVPLLPGCASAPARATASPTAAPALQPSEIPPPPAGLPAMIEDAWASLRAGEAADVAMIDTSPEGMTLAGYVAMRRGDRTGAVAAFETAISARPEMAAAEYGMGLVALDQGRRDVARQWFERALEHDPKMVRAAVQLRVLAFDGLSQGLREAESAERAGELDLAATRYRAVLDTAPDVAALYLRLAEVLQARSDPAGALATLEMGRRRAGDAPALLRSLGDAYRGSGRYAEAYDVLRTLAAMRPADGGLAALTEETRRLYEESSLPPEYRELAERPSITREELAAILAIALEGFDPPGARSGAIVSDTPGRWSAPFVQRMVEWGVLDVYQNNAFWPDLEVTRSMLVEAAYRAVEVLGLSDAAPRPRIPDPPPEHLLYRPAQTIVGLGVMEMGTDGSFDLLEPVSGREAIRTAERLADALRRLGA